MTGPCTCWQCCLIAALGRLGEMDAAARDAAIDDLAVVLADALSLAGRRKAELTVRAIAARRERLIRARAGACAAIATARLHALGQA